MTPLYGPIPQTRPERVALVLALIQARELACSAQEYDVDSERIARLLGLLGRPGAEAFATQAEIQRAPWIRVLGSALASIAAGTFHYPHALELFENQRVLLVRLKQLVAHADACGLPRLWPERLGGRATALRHELLAVDALVRAPSGEIRTFERALANRREAHLVAVRTSGVPTVSLL